MEEQNLNNKSCIPPIETENEDGLGHADHVVEPKIGMHFDTYEGLVQYYESYARQEGFAVFQRLTSTIDDGNKRLVKKVILSVELHIRVRILKRGEQVLSVIQTFEESGHRVDFNVVFNQLKVLYSGGPKEWSSPVLLCFILHSQTFC
ncbi:hypothetical protein POM88_002037 [Heracleum sosnowskyi]|uniref:DUF1421 domain-containing protein n=1 Tax=Heracleum sosnowskyi TaxID=360622 RepID=A0AAD8JH99_9APIA|nr:hypothetical protein POM88_002037 [Heracleum sosnowskyi]